jgi:hypothetical protein
MHPLAADIRNMCHSIMPGWEDDGMWGNKIEIKGYVMRAQGNGGAFVPPELVVCVRRLDSTDGTMPFCRIIDRSGRCTDQTDGVTTYHNGSDPSAWMKESIHEALAWIAQNS